ncbi:protein kinase [Streptomyces sp. SID8111]|uniref:serine/threonine protein kinase n=1 Tax=Streptomyces sp. SID8111 TaxID=2706100 RepID=UPI0013C283BB|nr:serine/threonine-protein kinase [Streptomyces sp. SID8111]NEC25873.1 protein kinase [Streptomyces sp. SID8111]
MTDTAEAFQPLQDDDPRTVGEYRLAARLGAGGMGRVYLAHTHGGRPVAVKVVRSELADDPTFRRRFAREVGAARTVKGAYTAELIDADPEAVPPWLATLYVPGPSLTEAVARRGPLSETAVLWLTAGIAEALQAIHGAGIVHRDLKPSNVLLASDGPRVIDFGIARAVDATAHTATGATIGTPHFMAPEQASGGEVSAATDVFALAQTAAFAALGRPLYGDGPGVSVLYRIVHSAPDLSELPDRLRGLLARCLVETPEERPAPAEVVAFCREELGRDAGAGAGADVWREIAGPQATVPPPVTHPEPAATPTAVHTMPVPAGAVTGAAPYPPAGPYGHPYGAPYGPFAAPRPPSTPEDRRSRRRRLGLYGAAGVAAVGLVIAAAWTVLDAVGDLGRGHGERGRDTAASASGTPGPDVDRPAGSGGAGKGTGEGTDADVDTDKSGTGAGADADAPAGRDTGAGGAADADGKPRAHGYSGLMLTPDNSLRYGDGTVYDNRKEDIRFSCSAVSCELESDTVVFTRVYGDPGDGTHDMCDLMTANTKTRRVPTAAIAAGTEICVRDQDGNVGLIVVETKSTAIPKIGFLRVDLTVWRKT